MEPVRYSKDEAALTADTLTVEVEMKAESSSAVWEGLDLVAVLDVSGRVYRKKMEYMKEAMMLVMRKLSPVDRLSIVTFSDVATRLCPLRCMTPGAQDDLVALVNGLESSGSTNIRAGLETGLTVIADRVNTKGRVPKIFLFSDGHQTSGDARQVDPGRALVIYTFGLGRGTDHRLMIDVTEKSPFGAYSSANRWSISQLLGRLLTAVAHDVVLTITPHTPEDEDHHDVDTIVAVVASGTNFRQATDAATGVINIFFGSLSAGEERRVVVNFTLKDSLCRPEMKYWASLAEVSSAFTIKGSTVITGSQSIQILRTRTASPQLGRRQLEAVIDRRRPDHDIEQVAVRADGKDGDNEALDDGQLLLNRLHAELLRLTETVVHVGSDSYLEQAKNSGKAPPRRRAPPTMRI
ncbi:hypothetical protein HU200_053918 [Digitaria exilis]|uniref:VWFA domain-containing protein n=1 Tax=Digitaria exilis TaxID=1010633 RepID=A0A835AN91_9POAL|nr:hypothetical protein HU200_053918 [Digitaria exilis]